MRLVVVSLLFVLVISTVPLSFHAAADAEGDRVVLHRFQVELDGAAFVTTESFDVVGAYGEVTLVGTCAPGASSHAAIVGVSFPAGAPMTPVNDESCGGRVPNLDSSRVTSGVFSLSVAANGTGTVTWVVSGVSYDPLAPPPLGQGEMVVAELDVLLDPSQPLFRHATLRLDGPLVALDAEAVCPTARGSITIVESDANGAAVLNVHCDTVGTGGHLPDVPAGNYRVVYEGVGAGPLKLRITGYPA